MSLLDIKQAKQALAWRLADWGVTDAHVKAAGFIDDLVARGWQMAPEREARPQPPRNDEACRTCGRRAHAPDRVCDTPAHRPPQPADPDTAHRYADRMRAQLHPATKETP